jgi:hypothetical protein
LIPWQLYERQCHYEDMTYFEHLKMNLGQVWVWLSFSETKEDREFERKLNSSWQYVLFDRSNRWTNFRKLQYGQLTTTKLGLL